jgi:hypothetical protein
LALTFAESAGRIQGESRKTMSHFGAARHLLGQHLVVFERQWKGVRSMKQIIENYRMGQAQLKTRVAQLKNSLSDRTLSLMERQNLDRRRRLLLEEYYEMEQLIRTVLPYLEAEKAAESAGDSICG